MSSARAGSEFIGKRTLVVGSGHSAINVAIALMELQDTDPTTEIFWALSHDGVDRLLGGGLNDQLPERGALGLAAKQAMDEGRLNMLTSFSADAIMTDGGRRCWRGPETQRIQLAVDQIVVTTGFRPDFSFLRELRIEVDPLSKHRRRLPRLSIRTCIPAAPCRRMASRSLHIPRRISTSSA